MHDWLWPASPARRDLVQIGFLGIGFYILGLLTNYYDKMLRFMLTYEGSHLDELLFGFYGMGLGLGWYAVRRHKELKFELGRREAAEHRATELAMHDVLTGLPNRRKLVQDLDHLLQHAREGAAIGVAAIDLDRFKPVNDLYGHAAGDEVLVNVAQMLRQEAGDGFAARVGGDEFIVVWSGLTGPEALMQKLAQVSARFTAPMTIGEAEVSIGATIGAAFCAGETVEGIELMRRADVALYRAREVCKGGFGCFDPALDERVQARLGLERRLREALATEQIEPFFQPLVDLAKGRTYGYEALCRLSGDGAAISPDVFIPLAEEIGLIEDLTFLMLRKSVRALRDLPGAPLLSINISPVQLRDPSLPEKILRELVAAGFPAGRLQVEITENALVADLDLARAILTSLRNQGVRISLDDFGTGYSSLRHLRELPFHNLKIDKSFVQKLATCGESQTIVRTIIDLAQNLGLDVVAEGVETEAAVAHLKSLGCGSGQGFWFGRPAGAAAAFATDETQLRLAV